MIAISLFVISLLGILSLIAFKRWELDRGSVVRARVRSKMDSVALTGGRMMQKGLPHLSKQISRTITHHTAYHLSSGGLHVVQFIERRLLKFVNMIKGKGVVNKSGSASPFLQDVAKHKNGLRKKEALEDRSR